MYCDQNIKGHSVCIYFAYSSVTFTLSPGNIESSFQHLRDKMERMTQRSNEHATDLQLFSHELGYDGPERSGNPAH